MFKFGIEHEVAFLNGSGEFVDFTNTTFEQLDLLINKLPLYKSDSDQLRFDRFQIMRGRWYVEGYERFNEDGSLKKYLPKGVEIRTTPQLTITKTIKQLQHSLQLLAKVASKNGFIIVWISYHPFLTRFVPEAPFTQYELKKFKTSPEDRTANLAMVTFGPDLNISADFLNDKQLVDLGKKLTFYSPFMVPFSFSSPFYQGKLWSGYSMRTFIRTGDRHAVRVFIQNPNLLLDQNPLTSLARIPMEKGRIEFKSFDSCRDFNLYAALLALIKGLLLDQKLTGRIDTPDKALHQHSALVGFTDPKIFKVTCDIFKAAEQALDRDPDQKYLEVLKPMLNQKTTPAQELIERYRQNQSIIQTLKELTYEE